MLRRAGLVAAAVMVVTLVGAPASGLVDRWAAWAPISGASNDYTTTMQQQAAGFPAATMASDSRSNVQLPSGASVFLSATTPPGAKYGASRNQPYVALRPKADTATTPSTTTYAFDQPTPDTGWAFVLGDIDSDQVRVSATDADGETVTAAEIDSWFAGAFNYAGDPDEPTWTASTATLVGNPGAADTDGASGWFEPDIRLTSLTFTFTRRAGFPVYQTWFVSRARPIGGSLTDRSLSGSCPVQQATLTLVSPYGEELATTSPAADGSYEFGEFATQAGYVVRLEAPDACAVMRDAEQTVSNRGNDGDAASRADFDVRAIVPQPISGTVTDGAGQPVAGVTVTLTLPGPGGTRTTTTAADGSYLFDDNAIGTGYAVSIAVPDGYREGAGGTLIEGIEVASSPVVDQDFTIVVLPSVSGTVTGGGNGLGGVQVVLTPVGGGPPLTTVTRGDGSYDLSGVPAGDYTLSIAAPDGFTGDTERSVVVGNDDLTGQDFALGRPGATGGQVTEAGTGAPRPGVEVVVDGPGGPRPLETDAEGRFFVDDLAPGTYDVVVSPPAGTSVVGPGERTVVITSAGEVVGGQDFVLEDAALPSPSPSDTATPDPTDSPTATPTDGPTDPGPGDSGPEDALPDTGGPSLVLMVLGVTLLLAGVVLLRLRRTSE